MADPLAESVVVAEGGRPNLQDMLGAFRTLGAVGLAFGGPPSDAADSSAKSAEIGGVSLLFDVEIAELA
ncbi:MAG TPA: hypothetical protein VMV10_17340 [Pirellulales bacterium]|nr:hypothetical protein [Pirellulales bacterium]